METPGLEHHHHSLHDGHSGRSRDRRLEFIATVIVAVSTLGFAWGGYQATVWHGIQAFTLGESGRSEQEALEKRLRAGQLALLDLGMFLQYERARFEGDPKFAAFLRPRFRPEMGAALDAWLAQDPARSDAAWSPFVMPEHRLQDQGDAERLIGQAAEQLKKSHEANRRAEEYIELRFEGRGAGPKGHATRRVSVSRTYHLLVSAVCA